MEELKKYIEQGKSFLFNPILNIGDTPTWINQNCHDSYATWSKETEMYLMTVYPNHPMVKRYTGLLENDFKDYHISTLREQIGILTAFDKINPVIKDARNADEILARIFDKFHQCAVQLKRRHAGRGTLTITDEYDVQNLLHAILKLDFDDIRPEEWTPSYAGGSKRMDFLLKKEKIAIEVKMTRDSLKDKELGEQMVIDIANYQQHADVESLYCFIYDPENVVYNPQGLEDDLSKLTNDIQVKVYVRPQ